MGKDKKDTLSAKDKADAHQIIATHHVYCWREHPCIFGVYGGRHSLRLACARQSVFLEDRELAGCVLDHAPRACDHAAAQYTGHNFTPAGMLKFAHAAGDALSSAEEALHAALAKAGALSDLFGHSDRSRCAGVLVMAKGLSRRECEETTVHECMHGLFYGDMTLQTAVRNYWHCALSDKQRDAWIHFLMDPGYNAERDEEIAVNELLAYMCTEKQLFSENSSEIHEVRTIRDGFVQAIQQHVPPPAPSVGQAGCMWQCASSVAPISVARAVKGKSSRRR